MSTNNFTTAKSITQNAVLVDFIQESQVDNNSNDLKYSGNTPEYYHWIESLIEAFTNPNILDIFSSQDPSFGSHLKQLGLSVQITDSNRDNLDFLNKLPDSDIENPAKFFDLLNEDISKQYQLIIWHNPQAELTIDELTTCLKKISNGLEKNALLITNIQLSQILINQFEKELKLESALSYKKTDQNFTYQVYKKI